MVGLRGSRLLHVSPPGRSRGLGLELPKKNQIDRVPTSVSGPWICAFGHLFFGASQHLDTMAPRRSAPAAPVKRKASSNYTKHSDGSRAKKPKTTTAPKRQEVDEDEGVASDSGGSSFSDSGDGGVELKDSQSARLASRPKENGRPAEGLRPYYGR